MSKIVFSTLLTVIQPYRGICKRLATRHAQYLAKRNFPLVCETDRHERSAWG